MVIDDKRETTEEYYQSTGGEPCMEESSEGYYCFREKGHPGYHAAGAKWDVIEVYVEWG